MEALRKHRLMPPAAKAEKAMQDREAEIAHYIRADLLDKGQPVPQALEEAAARRELKPKAEAEEDEGRMSSARGARLGDLARLAGAGSVGKVKPKYVDEQHQDSQLTSLSDNTPKKQLSARANELFPELAHSKSQAQAKEKAER
jgi:hypothetical protein